MNLATVLGQQEALQSAGFNPGKLDGLRGPRTIAAIKAFQAARRLDPDGIFGPLTRAAMISAIGQPDTVPVRRPGQAPKVQTLLSDPQIVDALAAGHLSVYGGEPSDRRLHVAWAMIALENAHGRSLWNWNFGNVSTSGSWATGFYVIRVAERIQKSPDVWKHIDMKFRSYPTAIDGSIGYWSIMRAAYGGALALFDLGDAYAAGIELGRAGYYTAHAEPYARAMAQLYQDWPG